MIEEGGEMKGINKIRNHEISRDEHKRRFLVKICVILWLINGAK